MRVALAFAVVAAALAVSGALATTTPSKLVGNAKVGRSIFKTQGCGSCHMMAAAGAMDSSGTGPDLDHTRKTYAQMITQITKGGHGMTPYNGVLTTAQIQDLAAFLYSSVHSE